MPSSVRRAKPSLVTPTESKDAVPHTDEAFNFVDDANKIHKALKRHEAPAKVRRMGAELIARIDQYGKSAKAKKFYGPRLPGVLLMVKAAAVDATGDYEKYHATNVKAEREVRALRDRVEGSVDRTIARLTHATAFMNLCNSARRLERYVEAVRYGEQAYELNPTNVQININYALALYYAGARTPAVLLIKKLLEVSRGDIVRLHLAHESELRAIPELADLID